MAHGLAAGRYAAGSTWRRKGRGPSSGAGGRGGAGGAAAFLVPCAAAPPVSPPAPAPTTAPSAARDATVDTRALTATAPILSRALSTKGIRLRLSPAECASTTVGCTVPPPSPTSISLAVADFAAHASPADAMTRSSAALHRSPDGPPP